jgi:hypothetical protein
MENDCHYYLNLEKPGEVDNADDERPSWYLSPPDTLSLQMKLRFWNRLRVSVRQTKEGSVPEVWRDAAELVLFAAEGIQ